MANWSAGQLPAPLNVAPGFKALEQAVNAPSSYYAVGTGEVASDIRDFSYPRTDPRRYGALLDGITDASALVQKAVDNNKGRTVIFSTGTALCAGITLSDSTYDGTRIICAGGELKLKARNGASNFDSSIWVGLVVTGAKRVYLDLVWDGNRLVQGNTSATGMPTEGCHCVVLAGADGTHIPFLDCREIAGDGLYIDWRSPLASSGQINSMNITVDYVRCVNTADYGRNAVSVISCDGLTIGTVESYQVGGTINGAQEPGGFDIEPNWPTQSVTDVVIGEVNVVTAGTSGFAVQGVATTNDAARDWNCKRVSFGTVRVRCTALGRPKITRVVDLHRGAIAATNTGARGQGIFLDALDRVTLCIATRNTTIGAYLGYGDWINDSDITLDMQDYNAAGIRTLGVQRTILRGAIRVAVASAPAIHSLSNGRALTQTGVQYEIDVPYDGQNSGAFYNTPGDTVTIGAGTVVRNCDWSGYASLAATITGTIPFVNVQGLPTTSLTATAMSLPSLSVYANNTAALAGGLVAGQVYRTATGQLMVTF